MKQSLDFLGSLSREDKIFANTVAEKVTSAVERHMTSFTFFLTEGKTELAVRVISSFGYENYMLYGGYDDAERVMLGVFAPYDEPREEDFPICAVSFHYREKDKLSHRDFLGSLMSLGISRETVGDIIVGDSAAAAFLTKPAARLALDGITKIGRVGVKLVEGFDTSINCVRKFKDITGTVQSLRLDCAVSLAAGCSRSKAEQLIASGAVSIKGTQILDRSEKLEEGDTISIKGYGKFILSEIGGSTKKNRIFIKLKKFI